jgi:hypothetical protein
MSQDSGSRREVSETCYEYLLGEILNLDYPTSSNDQAAAITQRLETIGHDIGYRYHFALLRYKGSIIMFMNGFSLG